MNINKKIEGKKLICGFCGDSKPFINIEQVPLRIDKNAKFQMLFDFRCEDCEKSNKKTNINNQHIRLFTGRSKSTDEQTVFDESNPTSF